MSGEDESQSIVVDEQRGRQDFKSRFQAASDKLRQTKFTEQLERYKEAAYAFRDAQVAPPQLIEEIASNFHVLNTAFDNKDTLGAAIHISSLIASSTADDRLSEAALGLLKNHEDAIVSYVPTDEIYAFSGYDALTFLRLQAKDGLSRDAAEYSLLKHVNLLSADYWNAKPQFQTMLANSLYNDLTDGTTEQIDSFKSLLNQFMYTADAGEAKALLIKRMLATPGNVLTGEADTYERFILNRFKIREQDAIEAWSMGWPTPQECAVLNIGRKKANYIEPYEGERKNISAIFRLEKERPGICAELQKYFGINCFGRYPFDALIKQYDERMDRDKPHALVVCARSDWNTSLYHNMQKVGEIVNAIPEYAVRFVEAGSVEEMIQRSDEQNKWYGDISKHAFGILAAHGSIDSMSYGRYAFENFRLEQLKDPDLFEGILRFCDGFDTYATVVLISCDTGLDEGVTSTLEKITNKRFIGPEMKGGIKSMVISEKPIPQDPDMTEFVPGTYLSFKVTYSNDKDSKTYES